MSGQRAAGASERPRRIATRSDFGTGDSLGLATLPEHTACASVSMSSPAKGRVPKSASKATTQKLN